jgi:hypothetical protein
MTNAGNEQNNLTATIKALQAKGLPLNAARRIVVDLGISPERIMSGLGGIPMLGGSASANALGQAQKAPGPTRTSAGAATAAPNRISQTATGAGQSKASDSQKQTAPLTRGNRSASIAPANDFYDPSSIAGLGSISRFTPDLSVAQRPNTPSFAPASWRENAPKGKNPQPQKPAAPGKPLFDQGEELGRKIGIWGGDVLSRFDQGLQRGAVSNLALGNEAMMPPPAEGAAGKIGEVFGSAFFPVPGAGELAAAGEQLYARAAPKVMKYAGPTLEAVSKKLGPRAVSAVEKVLKDVPIDASVSFVQDVASQLAQNGKVDWKAALKKSGIDTLSGAAVKGGVQGIAAAGGKALGGTPQSPTKIPSPKKRAGAKH